MPEPRGAATPPRTDQVGTLTSRQDSSVSGSNNSDRQINKTDNSTTSATQDRAETAAAEAQDVAGVRTRA